MNDIYALYSLFSLFILSRGTFYKIWILANFVLTPCLPSNISLPSISSSQFMSTWRKRQVSKETNLRIPKLKAFSSKILPLCFLWDEGFHGRAVLLGYLAYFNFGNEQGGGAVKNHPVWPPVTDQPSDRRREKEFPKISSLRQLVEGDVKLQIQIRFICTCDFYFVNILDAEHTVGRCC